MSLRICLLTFVALLLDVAGAQGATALVEQDVDPRPAAAGRSILFTAPDQASGGVRLRLRTNDTVRTLNAPTRRRTFDVSFGTDAGGRQVATYSDCDTDDRVPRGSTAPDDRRCDVMSIRTSPGARPHRVLRSNRSASFAYPVMRMGRIAAVAHLADEIGVIVTRPGSPPVRVGTWREGDAADSTGLTFDGATIAVTWALDHAACPGREPAPASAVEWRAETINVSTMRARNVFSAWCSPSTSTLASPSLRVGRLTVVGAQAKSTLITINVRTKRRRQRTFDEAGVTWAVAGRDFIVYTSASPTEQKFALRIGPLASSG